MRINTNKQDYQGITLRCIPRKDYKDKKAKRFTINGTNQNVWIPNKHLLKDDTIKKGEDIDYIFINAKRKCEIAGCGDIVETLISNREFEDSMSYARMADMGFL